MSIRSLRKAKKMTMQELADACGVTPSQISHIENGKRNPSAELARRLADVLGCTPAEKILGREVSGIEPDLLPLVDVIRTRPEVRELVEAMKTASPGEIRTAVRVLEAVKQP